MTSGGHRRDRGRGLHLPDLLMHRLLAEVAEMVEATRNEA